ncbi:MAG: DUF3147 family protein [Xanthomonadaceae bacterium]|nr:DUF3147 family protein [Xanthomonadaceae bacterium]MDE1884356.1 DUF3147 family protein [Xanthomonadaceae bacterium]MDE2085192.1 DUF3147 family protein [Xanthomonadaceae bacterium]MDE2258195.1 DUF3147 family protein [Xanthomonadaceae bacterium]
MWQYAIKIAVTAALIVAISELAKRSSFWGALLASLPITSLLAFFWIYQATHDVETIASLAQSIFWLVLASLPLFIVLPVLLRAGVSFWPSVGLSCGVSSAAYFLLVWVLRNMHVRL